MLEALKFVQGAVSKKDLVEVLTHFNIKDRRITGFNGLLALSSPIPLDLDLVPKASQLIKVIQACTSGIELNLTPTNKLSVRSGKFRAYVECLVTPYPPVAPEGDIFYTPPEDFIPYLKKLNPFVAEDDSRRWARGILFRENSAFATNNVILVEQWIGTRIPIEINIPKPAVTELLRIGLRPKSIQIGPNNLTFHYDDGRWLRTQQYDTGWPEVSKILDRPSERNKVEDNFFQAISTLLPFVNEHGHIYMLGDRLATSPNEDAMATVEIPSPMGSIFCAKQLLLLQGIVSSIDFTAYPNPCIFYGDKIRGAITGMRPL